MRKAKVVFTVLFVLCLISPLFTSANWTERQSYPICTQKYDQVRGIGEDGTMYRTSGISTDVWIDRYNGSTWTPTGTKCRGLQNKPVIIAPDRRHGFIVDTRIHHIRAISSPNGQDWTYGKVIAPELLFGIDFYSIACAWDTGDLYLAGEDYKFYFVKAPTYEEVREVKIQNCDLIDIGWASVNPEGTRLFLIMTCHGYFKDIYECMGRETNWGPPRRIGSISTNGWEHNLFAAKINGIPYLFFSGERENESGHYDIFYATEGTNPSVIPKSLGKLKTLFR